ncbi:hypothetical protein RHGRI_012778 [Rhododendron griersonianum]|uniref:Uncharacterized protein n=1 Tax=Rhododendron griersonianum TaxID=479676 RepID=A0AAV6KRZ5_9ERIC|nr:hypothetical protein RHGRI_012778 [Rhododendron griersonianum]
MTRPYELIHKCQAGTLIIPESTKIPSNVNDDRSNFCIKIIVDSLTYLIEGEEDEGNLGLPKLTLKDKEHVKFIKIPIDELIHEGTLSTISDMLSAVEIPEDNQPDMLDDITNFTLSMALKNDHNVWSKVLTMIVRIDAADYVVGADGVDVAVLRESMEGTFYLVFNMTQPYELIHICRDGTSIIPENTKIPSNANDDRSYFCIKIIVDYSTYLIEGEEDEGSLGLPKLTLEDKKHVKFIEIPVDKWIHEGTLSTISDMLSAVEIPEDNRSDMLDDITNFALSMAPKNDQNVWSKALTMIIRIDAVDYVFCADGVDVAVLRESMEGTVGPRKLLAGGTIKPILFNINRPYELIHICRAGTSIIPENTKMPSNANDYCSYFCIKIIVDSSTYLIEGEEDEGNLGLPKLTLEDKEHVKFIEILVDEMIHEGTLSTISYMLSAVEIPEDNQSDMLDYITIFALSMAPKNDHNVWSKVLTMIVRTDAADYIVGADGVDVAVPRETMEGTVWPRELLASEEDEGSLSLPKLTLEDKEHGKFIEIPIDELIHVGTLSTISDMLSAMEILEDNQSDMLDDITNFALSMAPKNDHNVWSKVLTMIVRIDAADYVVGADGVDVVVLWESMEGTVGPMELLASGTIKSIHSAA